MPLIRGHVRLGWFDRKIASSLEKPNGLLNRVVKRALQASGKNQFFVNNGLYCSTLTNFNMDLKVKENLVRIAMGEAEKAVSEGNIPFGAVLADLNGNVIEIAHNTANADCDPSAHAEINVIKKVTKQLGTIKLRDYVLVSNAQSCPMCFSAAIGVGIRIFIFGASSEGHMNPNLNVLEIAKFSQNPLYIETGILKTECEIQIANARKALQLNKKS